MILLVDNYDSFSYNLFQMVGEIDPDIRVIRNDEMGVSGVMALSPERIILSPGPGRPEDAGILPDLIKALGGQIPILGVCLGHQAICQVFGMPIIHAKKLMHGKASRVAFDTDSLLLRGLPGEGEVARYHSLAADERALPDCLKVTARTLDGEIMAVEHRDWPIYGVQFHPESILTENGREMLENFILCEGAAKRQTLGKGE